MLLSRRKGLETEGQLEGKMRSFQVEVTIERAHCHAEAAWRALIALSVLVHFFFCATTLAQRTCCDLKGIPLANNTLKTAKHLGQGTGGGS